MATTYAIDYPVVSAPELELIVRSGRRLPDAKLQGLEQARSATGRIRLGLSIAAIMVWAMNVYLVVSHGG